MAELNTNYMTLLEQAKQHEQRKYKFIEITPEVIHLVFAWLKDEVKDIAVRKVLSENQSAPAQSYPTIARALKQAYREGKLTLHD